MSQAQSMLQWKIYELTDLVERQKTYIDYLERQNQFYVEQLNFRDEYIKFPPLPPEAGGAIEVEDECGRILRYDAPTPIENSGGF